MSQKINIVTQHYFPFQFIALGIGLMITGVISSGLQPLLGVGLIILGIIFTSTHYRLRIDVGRKTYKNYLWLLGYQKGEELTYQQIDYIYINQADMSSGYGFATRINVTDTVYKAYLKLLDDESIFIGESKKEERLMKKVKKISSALKLEIKKNY